MGKELTERPTSRGGEQCSICETNWTTDEKDLLLDIKCLMKEYYFATFTEDGNGLKISFTNGQSFILSVTIC